MTPPAGTVAAPARPLVERQRRPLAPARPRRVSGPARAPAQSRRARARERDRSAAGVAAAIVQGAVAVYEHRLLDRVLRGRLWIGLVTFALLGIVSLQLALLQMNGSIGRELQRKAKLLRENAALNIENSALASEEHVIAAAVRAGMVPVSIKSLRFLDAHAGGTAGAVTALRTPVQSPSSEATSAAAAGGEGSRTSESAAGGASSSSSSTSSEASGSSEGSQAASSSSQGSEAGAAESSASASSESSTPAASEAGGSSAGGG
jgi:hypothetical protein